MITVINVPVANMYSQPDNHSEVVSQAIYGWEITLLSSMGEYVKIQSPDGYQGWVEKILILDKPTKSSSKLARIIHNAAHIYHVPDTTKRKPLLTLPFEVELDVVAEPEEEQSRWVQVRLIDGTPGWIQRGDVTLDHRPIDMPSMLALSRQFIGLPYTWGGVSSFGYDCSGYVQMLYRQKGILLPRDAKDQIKSPLCTEISLQEVEGGDLLFFGPSKEKITHVGLCLDGKNMIHATVKPIPILQITRLDDKTLADRFVYHSARRISRI